MDAFTLRIFEKDLPDQFLNVGVSEQNMINVAAGLALAGKMVFCYSIASFATMRCLEQIKVNICSMNLPVTIIGAGAGFSFGYDGPTHHGHQDLSTMRLMPEMHIIELSSSDLAAAAAQYLLDSPAPCYVRLDKGPFPDWSHAPADFDKGYRILRPMQPQNIVTNGFMARSACAAVDQLAAEGIEIGVVDLFHVKPVGRAFLNDIVLPSKTVFSLEESCVTGGLGSMIADEMATAGSSSRLVKIGSPDRQFIEYGTREWFHEKYGLDQAGIVATVKRQMVQAESGA